MTRRNQHGPSPPELAVLVSSFQKPNHLRRCLESLAWQRVAAPIEVIVTDDGSQDETLQVVRRFAKTAPFPVDFTTHPHTAFQLARCRNEGVRASRAPYILFLDGDCVLPPDHLAIHLELRQPGQVMSGDCCRLDEPTSQRITNMALLSGQYRQWLPRSEIKRLARRHRRAQWYALMRHPRKPSLIGNNIALWRTDYERINGYDENFESWGCEDDDLGLRLRRAGVRVRSILGRTFTLHLWHPPDQSAPARWREGRNVAYLEQPNRPIRCINGLWKPAAAEADQPPAKVA